MSNATFIERENFVNAHNYNPIPIVINRGEGVWLWVSISTVIRPVIRTLIRPLQTFKILLKIA